MVPRLAPSIAAMTWRVALAICVAPGFVPDLRLRADEVRPGATVRVAVLAYGDKLEETQRVEHALGELRAAAAIAEPFEVARGTYADVLHWLDTGAVDLAIVTPAVFAK